MSKRYLTAVVFLLIFLVIAFTGLYIGQNILYYNHQENKTHSTHWHLKFHHKLKLTKVQMSKLSEIEEEFSLKRKALEQKIQSANKDLAAAIKSDKAFSIKVQEATNQIHQAMGELQKETLQHLFKMQPILTDEQNRKLEQLITDALEAQ